MKILSSIITLLAVAGCTTSSVKTSNISPPSIQQIKVERQQAALIKKKSQLTDYIQRSTHELIRNTTYVQDKSVIAMTNFVFVGGDFNDSPLFASQIKESYIYEFYRLGQPILELRSSGLIKVTDKGEFFLTKDYRQLRSKYPIDYVLVGTISRLKNGVMLNTRIVGAESFAVVGASQLFIPQSAINDYIPSLKNTRKVKLVKG